MIKIYLIRHGQTPGNKLQRYIGTTDESLSEEGRELLSQCVYPSVEKVYASPLKRCKETEEILFPGQEPQVVKDLAECDFGEFENKNYRELAGNKNYQKWIDSNGTLPFPGGESREECRTRNLKGFRKILKQCIQEKTKTAAIVCHGGTIMNIMEAYADQKRSFYEWHVKNGGGYLVEADGELWQNGRCGLKLCDAYMEG